jgi:Uma2 family endonuclease
MTTLTTTSPARTAADLLRQLGGIPLDRILLDPAPGRATERDLLDLHRREGRICELIDGTLVEKPMGLRESILAGALIALLRSFVLPRNLGVVSGEAGMMRLMAGLVRVPDVAFVSWDRLPGRSIPREPIPDLAPDLAIEVLSPSNTPGEMKRKLDEYFSARVRLVWIVDPERRTAAVHTDVSNPTLLDASGTLTGGDVLPGFQCALADLFAELDRRGGIA